MSHIILLLRCYHTYSSYYNITLWASLLQLLILGLKPLGNAVRMEKVSTIWNLFDHLAIFEFIHAYDTLIYFKFVLSHILRVHLINDGCHEFPLIPLPDISHRLLVLITLHSFHLLSPDSILLLSPVHQSDKANAAETADREAEHCCNELSQVPIEPRTFVIFYNIYFKGSLVEPF